MTDPTREDALQPGWLMYLACDPPLRLWSGVSNFKLGAASGPDTAGGIYYGLGIIVGVPSLKLPLNGSYAAHAFSLSGVTAQMLKLANADRDAVKGSALSWARVDLDADGNPTAAPAWLWKGWCDGVRLIRDGSTNPVTRTVTLLVSAGAYRRKVRQYSYWTPSQQALVDPTDTACNMVPTLAFGTDEIWPN